MGEASYPEYLKLRRAALGLTQRQLAQAAGVKQPLIAALETGGRQPTAAVREMLDACLAVRPSQLLPLVREQLCTQVELAGGRDIRIFGSVASGQDRPDSDLDLVITFGPQADIVTLLTLEDELSALLTRPVDIVSAGSADPDRVLAAAVPL